MSSTSMPSSARASARRDDHARAALGGRLHACDPARRCRARRRRAGRSCSITSGDARLVDDRREHLRAAHHALQRARVAAGDDATVVDDDDVVGEPLGLLQVLRRQQDRRALVHERLEHVPQLDARARVEARWSARRGTAPRARRPASPPGRGGGACRRSRSWPGARRRRSARTARAARPRGLGRPRGRGGGARRSSTRFSRPVSRPSTVASCAARPMHLAHRARILRGTSMPATRAVPASGRGQRRQDADRRRLAGAVRAEQPADRAARAPRSRRRRARPCRRTA